MELRLQRRPRVADVRTEHSGALYGVGAGGEGRGRNLKGILKGYSDGIVTVDVDGTPFEVPHHVIDRAWVQYRFDGETTK